MALRANQNPPKELSYPSCLLKPRNTLGLRSPIPACVYGRPKKKGHGTLNLPWRKISLCFYTTFRNAQKGKKLLRLVKKILDFYLILSLRCGTLNVIDQRNIVKFFLPFTASCAASMRKGRRAAAAPSHCIRLT